MKKITISDNTLFTVAEEKSTLTFREKLNLVAAIDGAGFDSIILPSLLNEKENAIVYRTIATSTEKANVVVSVSDINSVESAYNSIV